MTTITRKTIQQIKSFRLGPLFKGRLNRKPYAWFIFLFCVMQLVIVIAYPYFLVGMTRVFLGIEPDTLIYSDRVYTTSGLIGIWAWFIGICAWLILSSVLSIVLCIVLAGAMRRRLHDCGYSGKYLLRDLILFAVPVIVSITRTPQNRFTRAVDATAWMSDIVNGIYAIISLGIFVCLLFDFVYLLVKRSQPADNKYGPVPDFSRGIVAAILNKNGA